MAEANKIYMGDAEPATLPLRFSATVCKRNLGKNGERTDFGMQSREQSWKLVCHEKNYFIHLRFSFYI